jgi:hypothetical protein
LRHPSKQPLNDADIERIKEIANVELEDARIELERANVTAQTMGQRHEESDGDDVTVDDEDDSAWVEYVVLLLPRMANQPFVVNPWTKIRQGWKPLRSEMVTFLSTSWILMMKMTMGRHRVRLVTPYLESPPYVLPSSWSFHQHKRATVLPRQRR